MYKLIITTITFLNGTPLPAETTMQHIEGDLRQCKISATNLKDRWEVVEGGEVAVIRTKARCMALQANKNKIKLYEEK